MRRVTGRLTAVRASVVRAFPSWIPAIALAVGLLIGYWGAADAGRRDYDAMLKRVNREIGLLCRDVETWAVANPRPAQFLFDNTSNAAWEPCRAPWKNGGDSYER
ncbi:MAG: hypothetical protein E6J27_10040 [Chloroflexi bacterium]|nr:MAG: hypothetical protein E6J27_10040 [Chloroflexota bacterium]TMC33677.1 MAG: hypothetical protein E6J24_08970 [Chloroflexota bacterium]